MIAKQTLIVLAVLILPAILTEAACPNKCSGHGTCGSSDACTCHKGWQGGDCSERICPFTRAWIDTAAGNNDAHWYAECGNHGTCDRKTGVCICDPGFSGSGCRRMSCPADCSGHGTCEFIEERAADTNVMVGGASGRTYTLWDQEKIMGCKCDPGYQGHDCKQKRCPVGDDPLTTTGRDMTQSIQINTASVNFYLTYNDQYGNSYTTAQITGSGLTDDGTVCTNIQTALRRLPLRALDTVSVAYSGSYFNFDRSAGSSSASPNDANYIMCIVTFPSTPGTTGQQNLLGCTISVHSTAGMQPVSSGHASATCTVSEHNTASVSSLALTESATCSNRGTCDRNTGTCICYSGHKGLACESQEALV